jgi:hypothetical protein
MRAFSLSFAFHPLNGYFREVVKGGLRNFVIYGQPISQSAVSSIAQASVAMQQITGIAMYIGRRSSSLI